MIPYMRGTRIPWLYGFWSTFNYQLDSSYVELAFPGYLGFGDHLCINLLSPACLHAFIL